MPATQTLTPGLRRWTIFSAFWRPVGVIYLLVCLAGLGAGFWPDVIYPSPPDFHPAPLPVLQTLAVAQVGFFLLIYPIILFRRNSIKSALRQAQGGLPFGPERLRVEGRPSKAEIRPHPLSGDSSSEITSRMKTVCARIIPAGTTPEVCGRSEAAIAVLAVHR